MPKKQGGMLMTWKEYVDAFKVDLYFFAVKYKYSYSALMRYYNGSRPRYSVAVRLVQDTKGEVSMHGLGWNDVA